MAHLHRRQFVKTASALGVSTAYPALATGALKPRTKSVAAAVTVYRKNSHADVIITKILQGWKHDGGSGPALRLASLYVDQFPKDDMAKQLAQEHNFPIHDSISDAITLGTEQVSVDGVLSIGEHGDYPWNDLGQHLYPRRRFWEEITRTFEQTGKVVPVFNDKHPGPRWSDAWWMYERAKELKIPWMAGSSLPVSFRDPEVTLPMGARVDACVGVGYSGLDIYGFHTLDFLQCIVERRAQAESGVRWVQSLPASSIQNLVDDGTIHGELMDAALKSSRTNREAVFAAPPEDGAAFLVQYNDGLRVPILMLPGKASAISVAFRESGKPIRAVRAEERPSPRYPHFAYLLKGIEQMFHTGTPAYPVERSLLSAGILDRLLHSRKQRGKRLETPELAIRYRPVDYGYAPHIDLQKRW